MYAEGLRSAVMSQVVHIAMTAAFNQGSIVSRIAVRGMVGPRSSCLRRRYTTGYVKHIVNTQLTPAISRPQTAQILISSH